MQAPEKGVKTIHSNNASSNTRATVFPCSFISGMSDVSHIKLCIDYEPTNNAMTFGLLTVIPVKPQLSALIHHDAFQRLGHEHSGLKATQCAKDRNDFLTIRLRGCCLFSSQQHTHQILLLMLRRVKLVLQGVWEG